MANFSLPMIQVEGPARFYIGAQNCSATQYVEVSDSTARLLGIGESGAQLSISTKTNPVHSDDNGGTEGTPAEIILLGSIGSIRTTLVKYNANAWASIVSGVSDSAVSANGEVTYQPPTEGEYFLPGTPIFGGAKGFALWIVGATKSFYFPKCEMASQPREFNISTGAKKTSITATAYPVYNSTNGFLCFYGNDQFSSYTPTDCNGYGGSVSP